MNILETRGLKKYYGQGDTLVRALDGVDLTVADGEFVSIVGTSGSGKSTLLHLLGGLDRPTAGSVIVEGKNIFCAQRRGAHHLPQAEDRLCLSVLQPRAGARGIRKYRPAHPARRRKN